MGAGVYVESVDIHLSSAGAACGMGGPIVHTTGHRQCAERHGVYAHVALRPVYILHAAAENGFF